MTIEIEFWGVAATTLPVLALALLIEARWSLVRLRADDRASLAKFRLVGVFFGLPLGAGIIAQWIAVQALLPGAQQEPWGAHFTALVIVWSMSALVVGESYALLGVAFAGFGVRIVGTMMASPYIVRVAAMRLVEARMRWQRERLWRQNWLALRYAVDELEKPSLWRRRLRIGRLQVTPLFVMPFRALSRKKHDHAPAALDPAAARQALMDSYNTLEVLAAEIEASRERGARFKARMREERRQRLHDAAERSAERFARVVGEPHEFWAARESTRR